MNFASARTATDELAALEDLGLRRHLRRVNSNQGTRIQLEDGATKLNFSSNDYLALADEPAVKELFCQHIARYGAGSGASRLVCGTLAPHVELEESLAAFKNTPAALTFSSGYAVSTGVLPALMGKGDTIILDKLSHASLVDGARLSGATLRVFPHNDLDKLAAILRSVSHKRQPGDRVLIVTESVFSMDGDLADLPALVALKETHNALLLVDEAHAFGVLGPQGRGLAAATGMDGRIDLQMGTFSKAAGLSGGYLCAGKDTIDLLINRARSFIYSTAPSPALAATIRDTLGIIAGAMGEQRRHTLQEHIKHFAPGSSSAIIPRVIGDNASALAAAARLHDAGFLIPAIRYPTVPRGTARLRITLSAGHEPDDIRALSAALDAMGLPQETTEGAT